MRLSLDAEMRNYYPHETTVEIIQEVVDASYLFRVLLLFKIDLLPVKQ